MTLKRKNQQALNIGVVGATGMVGEVFLNLLQTRESANPLPIQKLKLFASDRSLGSTRIFKDQPIALETLKPGAFQGLDLVFFSSGDDISKEWAPQVVSSGGVAIDNSAAFRMDPEVPLIVPEVNGDLLDQVTKPMIIANPNCSTIQLVVALNPLHKDFGLESVHVATYQAVSGAGLAGQEELKTQVNAWTEGKTSSPKTFPHPIAMNCIPQIGSFNDQGFCSEEVKIMKETKKILRDPKILVSAFTVRIPAWNSHSEAVWVRLKERVTREQILTSFSRQPGLNVFASQNDSHYPTAKAFDGLDPVGVGRLHQDPEDPYTWLFWVVADNVRKGAALNGIQIAETIF